MAFTDWIGSILKGNQDITIQKIKEESIDMGSMVAGNPSAAAGALSRMVDQRTAPAKVLMVQDGDYSLQVTEYAMKLAQRLDCEIIALDVTDQPLQFSGERKTRESDRFITKARANAEKFLSQAQSRGIKASHVMDIGNTEEIVARISETDAGIRYVLSKPATATARQEQDHASVPIFDLRCSRL